MNSERLLSVEADITIDIGEDRVFIRGSGRSIVVQVPSVSLAFRMIRELRSSKPTRERIGKVSERLSQVGLTVVFRTPSRRLVTLGQDGNSWLLRLLGVRNANLHIT